MNQSSTAQAVSHAENFPGDEPGDDSSVPRLLVVDDDLDILRLVSHALRGQGYEVDTAGDGMEAWELMQVNGYDLLLTDHNMPHMSGVELLKKLQSSRMDLPVIMIAGVLPQTEFRRHECPQPGTILLKPFRFEDLLKVVQRVLRVAEKNLQWPSSTRVEKST